MIILFLAVVSALSVQLEATCVSGTRVPKADCNQYYRCNAAGVWISYDCPTGLHYSTLTKTCESVKNANCFCKSLPDGKYRLDPNCFPSQTENYVTCLTHNVESVNTCPAYFIFDASEPMDSFCTTQATICQDLTTGFCIGMEPGHYVYPGSCTKYVNCMSLVDDGVLDTCPIGTVFSRYHGSCVSDEEYPIQCGGLTGNFVSLDSSHTDIRNYVKKAHPFNMMTELKETVSDSVGKYSGLVPYPVRDSASRPRSAYFFASDYTSSQPTENYLLGNPSWTMLVEVLIDVGGGFTTELLNFHTGVGTITPIATLVATGNHFEVQCPCNPGSEGTVSTAVALPAGEFWYSLKISYDHSLSTLEIWDGANLHTTQASFNCISDCGITGGSNFVNIRVASGVTASCLVFMTGTTGPNSITSYQDKLCPIIEPENCLLYSNYSTFDSNMLTTGATTTLSCIDHPTRQATIGCTRVPIEWHCGWSDFDLYECPVQKYWNLSDENALCYGSESNPRAIFPFHYVTLLRDVSYGLVGQLKESIVTESIDESDWLKLYDGTIVVPHSLGLNFIDTFSITFHLLINDGGGIRLRYQDGDYTLFSVSIYDDGGSTKMRMANEIDSVDCTFSDIRNVEKFIKVATNASSPFAYISVNGVTACDGFIFEPVYGNFEIKAIQANAASYAHLYCMVFLNDEFAANTAYIEDYCTNKTLHYTTQLLSAWPFNVVSSTNDLFGLNDITTPSYLVYGSFEDVPGPRPSFSAVNIGHVYPYIGFKDSRSQRGAISDDFSYGMWFYTTEATAILTIYDDYHNESFKLSVTSSGKLESFIEFNDVNITLTFDTSLTFGAWNYIVFSLKRVKMDVYQAQFLTLDYSKEMGELVSKRVSLAALSPYQKLDYIRDSRVSISSSSAFIGCLTYLDRAILTAPDAVFFAEMCPEFDVPCEFDYEHVAESFELLQPQIMDSSLETSNSTCINTTTNTREPVPAFCLVNRNEYLPRESCFWSVDSQSFECFANRTLFSPPCGSDSISSSLDLDYISSIYCPVLSPPVDGTVWFTNPSCVGGTVAGFGCNAGSYLVGYQYLTCTVSGFWDESVPNCQYVDCGDPNPNLKTLYNVSTVAEVPSPTYYDAEHTVKCIDGYAVATRASNPSKTKCSSSGTWSDPQMTCLPGWCTTPTYGYLHTLIGDDFSYNRNVTFKCISGYQFDNGEISISKRCNASLAWEPENLPTCVELRCNPPPAGDQAVYTPVKADYEMNDIITMYCANESYQLIGESSRTCLPSQEWSGSVPICEIRSCVDPGEVVGATQLVTSFNVNETISYLCNYGYTLSSSHQNMTCLPTGAWDNDKPTCTKISCPDPESGTSAVVTFPSTLFNDTALYTCITGYRITSGNLNRQCQGDATWSGSAPICEEIRCTLPEISNGTELLGTAMSSYSYGDIINLTCTSGYRWLSGSFSRSCSDDASWSGAELICEPKTCKVPYPRARLASYQPRQSTYNFRNYIIYTCLTGYIHTNGSINRTCLEDGSWSGSAPICLAPPGEDPMFVEPIELAPTEAEKAESIGIPVGALFLGGLLGILAMLDFLSVPKYYEFARRRLRKAALCV